MSDIGDMWKEVKNNRKQFKAEHGIDCPGCKIVQPKRIPTIMLPGQRCKVCGYKDKRERIIL